MNKTIVIIYDKKLKPETEQPAKEAIEYFKGKDCKVIINPKLFNIDMNIVIVYGGDGLLLHTANRVSSHRIPIVGVNYGRVGYLCKIKKDENYGTWDRLLNENYGCSYRTRICAEITNNGITEFIDALNEISIGGIDKTVYLKMRINSEFYKDVPIIESIGDGIIFSTKTGSTSYNANAGGSVLLTDDFSIVANNCSFQSDKLPINTKSLITNVEAQFNIEVMNKNEKNLPWIIADGQRKHKITCYDEIIIKRSEFETVFIEI